MFLRNQNALRNRWAHTWMLAWTVAIVPINICCMSYILFLPLDASAQDVIRDRGGLSERSLSNQLSQLEQSAHKNRARYLWIYILSAPVASVVWCFATVLFVEKAFEKKQLIGYLLAFSLVACLLSLANVLIYLGFTFWDNIKM